LVLLIFIAWAYLGHQIPDFFYGEEYDKISYPALYEHTDSWINYFFAKGRPVEGIYWTYLYEFVGFQPIVFRVLSLLLHALESFLAAWSVTRALKKSEAFSPYVGGLLVLAAFFNPYTLGLVQKISFDAPTIALVTYFSSTLCLQNWFRSGLKAIGWLIGSILLFVLTIFNYEIAAFLFPASLLLSLPFLKLPSPDSSGKALLWSSITGFVSLAFVLLPLRIYGLIAKLTEVPVAHPGLVDSQSNLLGTILQAPIRVAEYFIRFGEGIRFALPIAQITVSLSVITLILAMFFLLIRKPFLIGSKGDMRFDPITCAGFAGIWIAIGGLAPYALAGYETTSRVFLASIFGIGILAVTFLCFAIKPLWKLVTITLLVGLMALSVNTFISTNEDLSRFRWTYVDYFIDLTRVVGGLKENTYLILLDQSRNISGCGSSFQVLYKTKNIYCAFFHPDSAGEVRQGEIAERWEDAINAHDGGWIRNENIVILALDENRNLYLVPEITPADDYLIIWHDLTPIRTDYRRIEDNQEYLESEMYHYLILHQ
jgi:hypothetical protein